MASAQHSNTVLYVGIAGAVAYYFRDKIAAQLGIVNAAAVTEDPGAVPTASNNIGVAIPWTQDQVNTVSTAANTQTQKASDQKAAADLAAKQAADQLAAAKTLADQNAAKQAAADALVQQQAAALATAQALQAQKDAADARARLAVQQAAADAAAKQAAIAQQAIDTATKLKAQQDAAAASALKAQQDAALKAQQDAAARQAAIDLKARQDAAAAANAASTAQFTTNATVPMQAGLASNPAALAQYNALNAANDALVAQLTAGANKAGVSVATYAATTSFNGIPQPAPSSSQTGATGPGGIPYTDSNGYTWDDPRYRLSGLPRPMRVNFGRARRKATWTH